MRNYAWNEVREEGGGGGAGGGGGGWGLKEECCLSGRVSNSTNPPSHHLFMPFKQFWSIAYSDAFGL